ncbi:unnamed protein product [Brassica oleracea]|uniref:(rape) hypothetical protein n=1 Tax=Brassica napus TaxID=3708 RepID=A0A816MZE6_BRANA|nr:unnamed protein product [Brassica napus]
MDMDMPIMNGIQVRWRQRDKETLVLMTFKRNLSPSLSFSLFFINLIFTSRPNIFFDEDKMMMLKEEEDDELLGVLGYKVRSSEMAEVALKLEQSGTFIGSDTADWTVFYRICRDGVDGTG